MKILCPIDFSAGSKVAMQTAIRIASQQQAELVLAHVWGVPPGVVLSSWLVHDLEQNARKVLDDALRDATDLGAKQVTAKLLTGVPWTAIEALLADQEFELVVVGTHGRTGVARFLLGSVAEKIIRHAPCSALVVRPGNAPKPYQHVLCPIDFSVDSEYACALATRMVEPTGRISLLHISELADLDGGAERGADSPRFADRAATDLRKTTSIAITASTLDGKFPGAQLVHVIEDDPTIDLVVMGSHGRTGLRRALLGSVAEKLARHARCPVLIARSRITV